MKLFHKVFVSLPVIAAAWAGEVLPARAQVTVFDPSNYQQNLLSAARALEQVNNQIRSLENEAQLIQRMDQNLSPLGSTISPDLQRTLTDIETQIHTGEGISMSLGQTQSSYTELYPEQASATLSSDEALQNAKNRRDEDYAAFRRSALTEGEIADSVTADTRLLATAMGNSRTAIGALEATQAGNELVGLSVKQSLALQSLLAVQARAETANRARDLATEDDARQRFTSFIGDGSAYAASQ